MYAPRIAEDASELSLYGCRSVTLKEPLVRQFPQVSCSEGNQAAHLHANPALLSLHPPNTPWYKADHCIHQHHGSQLAAT